MSDATLWAAADALARSLREHPSEATTRAEFDRDMRSRVIEGIIAPARVPCLRRFGIDQTSRSEADLLTAMAPSFDHFFWQRVQGKIARAPKHARLSAKDTLEITLPVLSGPRGPK